MGATRGGRSDPGWSGLTPELSVLLRGPSCLGLGWGWGQPAGLQGEGEEPAALPGPRRPRRPTFPRRLLPAGALRGLLGGRALRTSPPFPP